MWCSCTMNNCVATLRLKALFLPMAVNNKYYVVWKGKKPGIYDTWEACQKQVEGISGAQYQAYNTIEEACDVYTQKVVAQAVAEAKGEEKAAKSLHDKVSVKPQYSTARPVYKEVDGCPPPPPDYRHDTVLPLPPEVMANALAVDAACSGNPGPMEYRCVHLATGQQIFHKGPLYGTNNIGEFLAIVHALALLKQRGQILTVYSDSRNALTWVKKKQCKTTLPRNQRTQEVYNLIERAESWLKSHDISNIPLLKWDTAKWGEIPADFGRK